MNNHKHNISELIKLYFDGETSIQEENILKEYFSKGDIAEEHQRFQTLFTYFSAQTSSLSEINKIEYEKVKSVKSKRFALRFRIAILSATAIILIALMLKPFNYEKEGSFELIINGKIVNNQELAMEIATRELMKFNIITKGLSKSATRLETIKEQTNKSLKPLEKIVAKK